MGVEFIGTARTADSSEAVTEVGPAVEPDYLHRLVLAHERSGFDRVLVTHSSSEPDGFVVADQVLSVTAGLGVLLAHRPGFIAPTLAARKLATLDALHPGRVALHVVTGGDDADQARDGDFTGKADRYRRTAEFLDVLRLGWASVEPFSYDGQFYRVRNAWSAIRPPAGRLPVYFGGASAEAVRVGSERADVYAFWGEPLAGIRERIAEVQAAAGAAGRQLDRFAVSVRPVVAATEAAAWRRARQLRELARERAARSGPPAGEPQAEGSRRLLRYAAAGEIHDARLWTGLATAAGAARDSTALVGSYAQVADALLGYVRAGASTLVIRGYEPLADAAAFGTLIELVHEAAGDDLDGYRARTAA
jgi:alkanesulfonate monooxygenase